MQPGPDRSLIKINWRHSRLGAQFKKKSTIKEQIGAHVMIWWVPSLVSHYPSFSRWVGSPEQLRPSLLLPGARFQVRVSQVWKLPVCGTAHRCRPGGAPGRLFCSKKSPKVVGNSKCDLLIKGDVRVQRDGPAKLGMLQSLRLSSALERSTFEKKLFEKTRWK